MVDPLPIGGEFELFAADFGRSAGASAWPVFDGHHLLYCDTGRSALALVMADWQARRPGAETIWLPHYICPSVVDAARASRFRIAWYDDLPGHGAALPQAADDDIVLAVHYFGFSNPAIAGQGARRWALIEDAVQAPYTAGIGAVGDYVIASLRKWWPAPDGAVAGSRQGWVRPVDLAPPDEAFLSRRLAAKLLRGTRMGDDRFLGWIARSEDGLAPATPRRVSWLSETLLATADAADAGARRRANWAALAAGIGGLPGMTPLYPALPGEVVPLAFPITVSGGRRDALRRHMAAQAIFCPIHWADLVDPPAGARDLAAAILSLPIDQRYGAADMQRILAVLALFCGGI